MKPGEKTAIALGWLAILAFIVISILMLTACQPVRYIPVETVKTEYREVIFRDSVYLQDSIVIKQAGDTVFLEKYRYLYRDKIVRDSVLVIDSIQVAYPVEVERPVNYVTGWQNFQIWMGRIGLTLILLTGIYLAIKRQLKW
ncbi:MAG: hypothetical protein LBM08_03855 [Dysgonamonadaceae bacterium]|jgi:hypothetical protein|nr:hypothetical protein [Dysgonamonadaceae bacterium]